MSTELDTYHTKVVTIQGVINALEKRRDEAWAHVVHVFAEEPSAGCRLCQEPDEPPKYCESCGHELP